MAIPKRLTSARKVVSRFDPSWKYVLQRRAYGDYCNTLDIEKIGSMADLPEPFTVFEILPLRVASEPYVDGENSNWWEIFRTHVRSIGGVDVEFDGDRIKEKHREEIGPVFIRDIAAMVIDLANCDGVSVFFTPPVGYLDFIQNCQRRIASEAMESVRSAVVKNSN